MGSREWRTVLICSAAVLQWLRPWLGFELGFLTNLDECTESAGRGDLGFSRKTLFRVSPA
jgi:hypothetical protein